MRKTLVWITLSCCLFAVAVAAGAQSLRKPGLYQTTSNMVWLQSPMPAGMSMPGMGPQTSQICLTQAWIDKYGAPVPTSKGDCQITNVVLRPTGMTADMVCTGKMPGKATVESSWPDGVTATGKVHFLGSMQMGPNSKPIEWTIDSTSTYKGPDCGSVKPMALPPDK
jgi:hypothetical protein